MYLTAEIIAKMIFAAKDANKKVIIDVGEENA